MIELAQTAIEWTGINFLAAQIMAWITANGALGLLIIAGLGVVLVFLAAVVAIAKIDRIPVTIPYARLLVPAALVMAMLVLLIVAGMGAAMFWREGSPPVHASPDAAEGSAGMVPHSDSAPDTDYADRDLD